MSIRAEFTYHQEFFSIALGNYREIGRLQKEIRESQGRRTDEVWIAEKNDRIGRLALLAVIFCALSIEAYINHYAIIRLSKSYLESYLDKLDLLSKWIIIPRIITGTQLDPGSKSLQNLSWLIKLRNKLVHYKSRTVAIDQIKESDFLYEHDAKRAIDTVRSLVRELKGIDNRLLTSWLMDTDD